MVWSRARYVTTTNGKNCHTLVMTSAGRNACLSKRLIQALYRTGNTTRPPSSSSDGARRSQPATAFCLTRRDLRPRLRPALVTQLCQELLGALLGAIGLGLGRFLPDHDLDDHVGHDARAVELGKEGQQVVIGPREAQRQQALVPQRREHGVVPGLPLLDAWVREVLGVVEHGLEDRCQMDRHRMAVGQVMLLLVEQLQE